MGGEIDRTETAPVGAAVPLSPARLRRGDWLGRYVVLGERGSGGMGVVYAAYEPELDRRVALKLLHADSEHARDRLAMEARALAKLAHPNVVRVHELAELDGRIVLAMEYVDGETVREWLESAPRSDDAILDVFLQTGRGLVAAHEAGLIHRDFKPSNAIIRTDGTALVLDFGLARTLGAEALHDEAAVPSTLGRPSFATATGALVGTPRYMAPELLAGAPADARSDQFSFCASLFEALYGVAPFGDSLDDRPPAAPRIHARGVARRAYPILARGLAADPAERFGSLGALLGALHRLRHQRRRWLIVGVVAVLALVIIGAATLGRDREATCAVSAADLDQTWDDRIRSELAATPFGTDEPADYARFASAMDAWASGWRAVHRDVCEATHVRGEQSETLLDARMACLDRHRAQVRALTASLRARPATLKTYRAVEAALSLPTAADCSTATISALSEAPPNDPVLREQIAAATRDLAATRALLALGELVRAQAAFPANLEAAVATRFAPVIADARMLGVELRIEAGEWRAAYDDLLVAVGDIATAGDDVLLAVAWQQLYMVAGHRGRHDEAALLAIVAEAATRRNTGNIGLAAKLAYAHGMVWALRDQPRAMRHFEEARALAKAADGATSLPVARSLRQIGWLHREAGALDEADARLGEARAIFEQLLGPDHPDVGNVLTDLGGVYAARGELDRAEQVYARALAIADRTAGPTSYSTLLVLDEIAGTLCERGRTSSALVHYERAIRTIEERWGTTSKKRALVIADRDACLARSRTAATPK